MVDKAADASKSDARRTDTRERALDVATQLFVDKGYAATSIRDITDELGITKAALYYHFPSKEHLLEAILADGLKANRDALEDIPADIDTPAGRRRYARQATVAIMSCDIRAMQVLQDPSAKESSALIRSFEAFSDRLAEVLAKAVSKVDELDQVPLPVRLRTNAAVAAGYAAAQTLFATGSVNDQNFDESVDQVVDLAFEILEPQK